MLIRLMNSPDDVTGPVNVGNPTELTVCQLSETIVKKTGAAVELEIDLPLPRSSGSRTSAALASFWVGSRAWGSMRGWKRTIGNFRELLED